MRRTSSTALIGLLLAVALARCSRTEVWREQYGDGKPKLEYEYYTDRNGHRVYSGYLREYFESGILKLEEKYQDGEREGRRVEYFENGKVRYDETFRHGKREGKRLEYLEDGTLEFERTFSDGKCISNC